MCKVFVQVLFLDIVFNICTQISWPKWWEGIVFGGWQRMCFLRKINQRQMKK